MQKAYPYRETRVIAIFAIKNAEQEEKEYSQEINQRRLDQVTLARFCLSKTLHAKYLAIVGTNHRLRFKKTTGLIFKTYITVHIWRAPSLLFTIIVF